MNSEDEPSTVQRVITVCVRLLGISVLVVGIGAAVLVIREAWQLYQEPQRIERFAVAIEQGSNLDRYLGPVVEEATSPAAASADSESLAALRPPVPIRAQDETLRLSYFVAWLVVLGLLLVLGILAMSAITTGGQLALYETPMARMRREVRKEVLRRERTAARAPTVARPRTSPEHRP